MANMVKYSTGFSLIETLCILSLMLYLFFFALPSCQQWIASQQCKSFRTEVENDLRWINLQAHLLHQDLLLDDHLMPMQVVVKGSHQVLKSLKSHSNVSYQWHSHHPLLFHANPLKNHVNGFFEIQCPNAKPLKLWINRLGHLREEQ